MTLSSSRRRGASSSSSSLISQYSTSTASPTVTRTTRTGSQAPWKPSFLLLGGWQAARGWRFSGLAGLTQGAKTGDRRALSSRARSAATGAWQGGQWQGAGHAQAADLARGAGHDPGDAGRAGAFHHGGRRGRREESASGRQWRAAVAQHDSAARRRGFAGVLPQGCGASDVRRPPDTTAPRWHVVTAALPRGARRARCGPGVCRASRSLRRYKPSACSFAKRHGRRRAGSVRRRRR